LGPSNLLFLGGHNAGGLTIEPYSCGAFAERGQVAAAAAVRSQCHHDQFALKPRGQKVALDTNLERPPGRPRENGREPLVKLSDCRVCSRWRLLMAIPSTPDDGGTWDWLEVSSSA